MKRHIFATGRHKQPCAGGNYRKKAQHGSRCAHLHPRPNAIYLKRKPGAACCLTGHGLVHYSQKRKKMQHRKEHGQPDGGAACEGMMLKQKEQRLPRCGDRPYVKYLFVIPSIAAFAFALLLPFCMGIRIAFTDWDGLKQSYNYVWFDNFRRMFTDRRLGSALRNTFLYAIMGVVLNNVFTLSIAMLFNRLKGWWGNICRLIVFIPSCLSTVLAAYVWKFIYHFVWKMATGLNSPLGSERWVLLAIVVIGLWNSAGINVLIYTAALRNIPHELLEAAAIDGAGRWRMFRTIILPMISSSFTICITLTFTGLLKEFGTVMAATGGGPAMASSTICMYIYNCLFSYNRAGYGQAVAISFMAVLVLIGTVLTNFFRKREVEL